MNTSCDRIEELYDWVYRNVDPAQAVRPSGSYTDLMKERVSSELAIELSGKSLAWVMYEVWSGRWRPGQ